jgi:transposase
MPKKYHVSLTETERNDLLAMTKKGKHPARTLARVQALLHADAGWSDEAIAEALHLGTATLERLRKRFVDEGLSAALKDRPRPGARRKLDGAAEATLIAWACSTPPGDRSSWTMQLLADKLIELDVVEQISDETVRRTLKKTNSSPG